MVAIVRPLVDVTDFAARATQAHRRRTRQGASALSRTARPLAETKAEAEDAGEFIEAYVDQNCAG